MAHLEGGAQGSQCRLDRGSRPCPEDQGTGDQVGMGPFMQHRAEPPLPGTATLHMSWSWGKGY